jgi:tetratricopeptide (TPR) repeat protein
MEADAGETAGLVERALELDPNLAEAYATRGFFETFHQWRWADAERDLKNSIRLKPNYGTAHQWLGILFEIEGRHDEALAEMETAVATDPTSPNFLADLGQTHYFRREYDQARQYCQKALEIDPDFKFAHDYLMNIALITGDLDSAVNEWKKAAIAGDMFANISEKQRKSIEEVHSSRETRYKNGSEEDFVRSLLLNGSTSAALEFGNGRLYALLGDRVSALAALEKGVGGNGFGAVFVKADPFFDSIKNEPRYQAIVKRMNLPAD